MNRYLLLLFLLIVFPFSTVKSQGPERGTVLPISAQNAADLEFGLNGSGYLTVNYDHMFFLKPQRFGPAMLVRAGIGDGLSPGYGMTMLIEAAYTTGYITFAELGAGYNGQSYARHWQHLPYFLAAFRYRANTGVSFRLYSRLSLKQSGQVPMFGMGLSAGFTF
jgi:hypothetical protein